MKVYKKYSYHISKLTVPSLVDFKSFIILFSETPGLFNLITHPHQQLYYHTVS